MAGVDREVEEGARSGGVPPPPPALIQQTELNGGEGGSISMARAEEARAGYGTAGDHWGVAVSSPVRAQGAIHAGERGGCSDLTAWQCGGSASPASNLSAGAPHTKHQPLGHTGLMAWRLLPSCCGNGPGSYRSWDQ
jgi:hypothetical protein